MPGFEFTPFGIMPMGASLPAIDPDFIAPSATARAQEVENVEPSQPAVRATSAPLTGRELVKMARERVKDINRQLAAMPALVRERDELARLIAAAAPSRSRKKGVQ